MKRLNSLFTVAMLAVSMVVVPLAAMSCSNDDEQSNGGDNPNEPTEFTPSSELVSYLLDGIDFPADETSMEVSFASNKSWSVSSGASWCTFSPSSGKKGVNIFSINIEKNQSSEERETIVTLQVAESAKYIKIRQKGNSNFDIIMENPGTLSSFLGNRYLDITTLRIAGPLNGDDFDIIYKMGDIGKLSVLDLSEATIVEGGSYNSWKGGICKTRDNEVTKYMFYAYDNLTELYLPHEVTKIGLSAICSCPKLRILKLSEKLRSIEYWGISKLPVEELELPEGLEELDDCALSGLKSLKSLTLPSTVKRLGEWVFSGAERLKSIHCKSVEPPVCNDTFHARYEPITNGAKLYVPKGSLSAYKNDEQWGLFETIIEE